MNSGNLLNTLLGATGTHATGGKGSTPKSRVETNENFRDALAQVRPDVAATKPAVRKAAPEANRPEARQPAEPVEARGKPARDVGKDRPVDRADTAKNAKAPAKEPVKNKQGGEVSSESPPQPEPSEAGSVEVVEGQPIIGEQAPSEIIPDTQTPTLLLAGEASADLESDEDTLLADGAGLINTPETIAVLPLIESEVVVPGTSQSLAEGEEPGVLAMAATGAQLASAGNSGELRLGGGSTLSATPLGANAPWSGLVVPLPESAEAVSDLTEVAEPSGDNPDFLLLGGKAVVGKLMDGNMAGEKAIDSAKPTLTAATPGEPLVRMAESPSPAARSFVAQTGIAVPVGQPQWSQAVGEKVLWLAAQNVSAAEIRLDPPDLGQLHVKVSLNQDQATVTFTSPHPAVREALDQQLSRLREMFSEQGLNLVNVDVSDRSAPQHGHDQEQAHAGAANEVNDEDLAPVAVTPITSTRLVDHYA